jgi:hypothetical protein
MATARPHRNAATQPRDAKGRFKRVAAPASKAEPGSTRLGRGLPEAAADAKAKAAARLGRMRVETAPAEALPRPEPEPGGATARAVGRNGPPAHEGWGPFYDLHGAARILRCSSGEAARRGEAGELLMVVTVEGDRLFPVWQFDGPRVHAGVSRVLGEFQGLRVDPWLIVQWATAPDLKLGGLSAVQWLHERDEVEPVLADAREYAWRWSH